MRTLVLALSLLLMASTAEAGAYLTGSVVNPAANAVVVTTGALADYAAQMVLFLRSTVAVQLAIERMRGGVAVPGDSVTFVLDPGPAVVWPLGINFSAGDTFRVRVVGAVTGTVQAGIRFNDGTSPGYCLQGLGCAH